jgi:hypothetical protein
MALFYNPTAIQAGSLLQRRAENPTTSKARQSELLSKALAEARDKDPLYNLALDKTVYEPPEASGVTGEIAKHLMRYTGEKEMKGIEGQYQDRQAKKNEMYSQILGQPSGATPGIGGAQPGGSPMDNLTPQQRAMIGPMLADPDMQEQAAAFLLKQSFEPGETPSYQTYTGSDGQQYAWNPKRPDEQPRALPNSQKPDDFENIETVIDGRPGIYRQNKRTGAVGDYVGALPPKQPSTVVNNIDNGEKSFNKKFGENQAANYESMVTQAQVAPQTIAKINEFRAITAGGVPTGKVQDMTLPARQFFNSIGITDDKNIAGQETINSIASNFVLDKFQSLKGPQTDKDAVLVASAVPQLSKSPEGNALILDLAERAEQYKIEMANEASKYVAQNGQLDANWISYYTQWAQQNPLLTPELRNRVQAGKSGKPAAQSGRPAIRNITVE